MVRIQFLQRSVKCELSLEGIRLPMSDSIDQNRLVDLICDQISDGRVLQLI